MSDKYGIAGRGSHAPLSDAELGERLYAAESKLRSDRVTAGATEAHQARILSHVRSLRAMGVPEVVLTPIMRFACVEMWNDAARLDGSSDE